jgi:hypothetical protein
MLRFSTTVTTLRAGELNLSSALYGQGRPFVSILGVAAASRQFWIGRLEHLHGITEGRGTRYSSATIRRVSANR